MVGATCGKITFHKKNIIFFYFHLFFVQQVNKIYFTQKLDSQQTTNEKKQLSQYG